MDILTTPEAANILRVHDGHAKRLLEAEGVRPLGKLGMAWAWSAADVRRVAARRLVRKFRRS